MEDLRNFLSALCTSTTLLDVSPVVRGKATETILKILEPGFVQKWDGSTSSIFKNSPPAEEVSFEIKMRNYWRLSSHDLSTIVKTLGDIQSSRILLYSTTACGKAHHSPVGKSTCCSEYVSYVSS